MRVSCAALALQLCALASPVAAWKSVNVEDFGAKGDNATDNTKAFRAALLAVAAGGGEVLVPAAKVYQTAPINLTSNVVLRVEGTMRAVTDRDKFPKIGILPSVGHDYDTNGPARRMPFVFAVGGSNITITGSGTIDAAGRYWWDSHKNHSDGRIGRPHLMELQSVDGVEITGVTLLNSGFWTLHPVYCKNVHIHHMKILNPDYKVDDYVQRQDPRIDQGEGAPNGDGIDVDSCQNVLIEHNYISCGDDHVTILSGTNGKGPPCKNITVRHNELGTGMGLSVGSSVAGGVEDVTYQHNWMNQVRESAAAAAAAAADHAAAPVAAGAGWAPSPLRGAARTASAAPRAGADGEQKVAMVSSTRSSSATSGTPMP